PGVQTCALPIYAVDHLAHGLTHAARDDLVLFVECQLTLTATFRFIHGPAHRIRDSIGVQDGTAVQVAGSTSDGLNKTAFGPQKSFLIGVEDRNQRDLGYV